MSLLEIRTYEGGFLLNYTVPAFQDESEYAPGRK